MLSSTLKQVVATFVAIFVSFAAGQNVSGNGFPVPKYFFPLSNGAMYSTIPERSVQIQPSPGVSSAQDVVFGSLFQCSQRSGGYITIPDVSYGEKGAFAIAFWMRVESSNDSGFDYLLSQQALPTNQQQGGDPTKVSLLLPREKDSSYGVLRAIVLDDNDVNGNETFLDSTGCVSWPQSQCPSAHNPPPVADGEWHFITLTTHANGSQGYELYLDGNMVGEMNQGVVYDTPLGKKNATGGNAMNFNGGNLYLCTSSPDAPQDIMTGTIADLMIFNVSLTPSEARLLYNQQVQSKFMNVPQYMCSQETIPGTPTQVCTDGHSCYILDVDQFDKISYGFKYKHLAGRVGLCVPSPIVDLLPDPMVVRPAKAFFPLTTNRLASYPLEAYSGMSVGAKLAEDDVFGYALYCDGSGYAVLDPVAYGIGGQFSINFWVRPSTDNSTFYQSQFAWLFSHGGTSQETISELNTKFGRNQVQIYLTESESAKYGQVSAYVRDNDDDFKGAASEVVVQGDGSLGLGDGINSTEAAQRQAFNLYDGEWHMITLTSRVDNGDGFVLYVDGKYANQVNGTANSTYDVGGGDPMQLLGDMFLCTSTFPANDNYAGKMAYLSIWEQPLLPGQVDLLYQTVYNQSAGDMTGNDRQSPNDGNSTDAYMVPFQSRDAFMERYTVNGKKCFFPFKYNNKVVSDCVKMGSYSQCDTGNGSFEVCLPQLPGNYSHVLETRKYPGSYLDFCAFYVGSQGQTGCASGTECVPLTLPMINAFNRSSVGICEYQPNNQVMLQPLFEILAISVMPMPAVMFPLAYSLESVTMPTYEGVWSGTKPIEWTADDVFGSAATCVSQAYNSIELRFDAPATMSGINLWFQRLENEAHSSFQPITSNARILNQTLQVDFMLYITHPRGGIPELQVGTFLTDGTPMFYENILNLENDTNWHMLTLTNTATGLAVYVDSVLKASLEFVVDASVEQLSGGSKLTLCSLPNARAKVSSQYYDGKIAHVMFFDTQLNASDVQSLYNSYTMLGVPLESGAAAAPDTSQSSTNGGGLSGGAIAGIVLGCLLGAAILGYIIYKLCASGRMPSLVPRRKSSFERFEDDQAAGVGSLSSPQLDKKFSYFYQFDEEHAPQTPAPSYTDQRNNGTGTPSTASSSTGGVTPVAEMQLSTRHIA